MSQLLHEEEEGLGVFVEHVAEYSVYVFEVHGLLEGVVLVDEVEVVVEVLQEELFQVVDDGHHVGVPLGLQRE